MDRVVRGEYPSGLRTGARSERDPAGQRDEDGTSAGEQPERAGEVGPSAQPAHPVPAPCPWGLEDLQAAELHT